MHKTTKDILVAKNDLRFSVRVAMSGDLEKIASLDVNEFHNDSVGLAGLTQWFEKYPYGAFVLEEKIDDYKKRIIGALGIWPVTQATFQRLIEGKLAETDIGKDQISSMKRNGHYTYWYVGDVIVDKEFRKKGLRASRAIPILLRDGLYHWLQFGAFNKEIEFCAIAVGDEGRHLLERFKFQSAKSSEEKPIQCPKGNDVYKLSIPEGKRGAYFEEVAQIIGEDSRQIRSWKFLKSAAAITTGILIAVGIMDPTISQMVGIRIPSEWHLSILAILICLVFLAISDNKKLKYTIVVVALIPIVLKFFKIT